MICNVWSLPTLSWMLLWHLSDGGKPAKSKGHDFDAFGSQARTLRQEWGRAASERGLKQDADHLNNDPS